MWFLTIFLYNSMANNRVQPIGRVQKKIYASVEALKQKGIHPQSIYETVCSIIPGMSDRDMYFLDMLLEVAHMSGERVQDGIINDVRISLGCEGDDFSYVEESGISFCRSGRKQFCDEDVMSDTRSYLAVAVKLANPSYGTSGATMVFDMRVETEDGGLCEERYCEFRMRKDEYTRVEYMKIGEMFDFEALRIRGKGCGKINVVLCEKDSPEIILQRSYSFLDEQGCLPGHLELVDTSSGSEEFTFAGSSFNFGDNLGAISLKLSLKTAYPQECFPDNTMQLSLRMDTFNEQYPKTVYMRYMTLERGKDGLFMYYGNPFEGVDMLEDAISLFHNGIYRISFMYMEHVLFHTDVEYENGTMSLVNVLREFERVEDLGLYVEESEQDDIPQIGSFADEFQKALENLGDEEISQDEDSGLEFKEIRMCSAPDTIPEGALDGNWFIMRTPDKYFHFIVPVQQIGGEEGIKLCCNCRSAAGQLLERIERDIEEFQEDLGLLCIPISSLCINGVKPSDEFEFDVSILKGGVEKMRRIFTGYAIHNIFDAFDLGHVLISNNVEGEEGDEVDVCVEFDKERLGRLYFQFGLIMSSSLENILSSMNVVMTDPHGNRINGELKEYTGTFEGERIFYTRFEGRRHVGWEYGTYTISVSLYDNKAYCDTLLRITFEVGDRNRSGDYSPAAIKRELVGNEEPKQSNAMEKLENLIGLQQVKKEVADLSRQVELARKRKDMGLPADMPFLHARFYGNPGTGKTTVAKLLGQVYKEAGLLSSGHVVTTERKKLIAGRWYDSVNKATMEAVDEAQGGILFIDEAYNLYMADDPKDPGQDVISTLMTVLSDEKKKDWMLVLAGYPLPMENMMNMNEGFKSRVPNVFHFNDYDAGELMQIAVSYCKEHVYTLTDGAKEHLAAVISKAYARRGRNFENARYVVNLLETVVLKRMGQRLTGIEHPTREMLTTIMPEDIPSLNEIKESRKSTEFHKMVGLKELKESIQGHLNYVGMCNNRILAGLSTQMPSLHMVFSGNPGTGKTTVADFIGEIYASMGILSEGNVIKVFKKDLIGTRVGETERKMREIFNRARGNVLFIDEAYALNADDGGAGRIVLDALVDELGNDNTDMIVILAGYPDEMEKLLDSNDGLKSRFTNIFQFNDYSVEELLKIALESKAAKDFEFTPVALQRLEAYIRREVLKKQKSFGNGRFVTRLITNVILPRMATRLSGIENPSVKQLKTILAEDIPISAQETAAVNGTGFDERLINDSLAKLDAMVGLPKVKQAIHNFVDVARYRNSIGEKFVGDGVLKWSFAGNTGTGKSTVARIFTDILKGMNLLAKGNFVEVKGEQIFNVSEYACDQVLKSAVDRSRYGMLFIDGDAPEFRNSDSYVLTNEQLKIKLTQLTAEDGGAGAIVVAECKARRQNLVASLASSGVYEFDHTIVFDDYTPDELFQILSKCLASHKIRIESLAAEYLRRYIADMAADRSNCAAGAGEVSGSPLANARTMKLLSRSIYEIVMLRESRGSNTPRRTVLLQDVEKFVWKNERKRVGY